MKMTYKIVTLMTSIAVLSATILINAQAAETRASSGSLGNGRLSIGGALGFSRLDPRVLTPGGRVTDDSSSGGKIYVGYDVGVKEFWHIEGFYADLGSASVDTGTVQGDIDYQLAGVSVLYKKPFTSRFKGIAKLGYADVQNDGSNNIQYRQVESGDIFFGLGAEIPMNTRLNIRGEYEYFDKDIQFLSVGLNYKF